MAQSLNARDRVLDLGVTRVMGVVNVTPDSFSDGGRYLDPAAAIAQADRLLEDGADILDVGGESTRPGAAPVSAAQELDRVLPVLEELRSRPVMLSIDTRKPEVARAAVFAGAHLVNDVSGLQDEMLEVAADVGAAAVAMHMRGTPETMQQRPHYDDVVAEVAGFLEERMHAAQSAGVDFVADPGIGFGKTLEHNLDLLANLSGILALGCPVLVGASRKSFLEKLSGHPLQERLEGTLAAHLHVADAGAHIVRVHDVAEHVRALQVRQALQKARRSPSAATSTSTTELEIGGLEVPCHIGVPEGERSRQQPVQFDVRLALPPRLADDTDSLAGTVDYAMVVERVKTLAASHPWRLVETLAYRTAKDLLEHTSATEVDVRVRKPDIAPQLGAVRVGCRQVLRRSGAP